MILNSNYSYNYTFRRLYSGNSMAANADTRGALIPKDLVKADASAMENISKMVRKLDFENADDAESIYTGAKAFVDTYNNLLSSTSSANSSELSRLKDQMKKLSKDQKDALSEIGITVGGSGKLSIKKKTFLESKTFKLKEVLGDDSSYMKSITNISRKIKSASARMTSDSSDDEVSGTSNSTSQTSTSGSDSNSVDVRV